MEKVTVTFLGIKMSAEYLGTTGVNGTLEIEALHVLTSQMMSLDCLDQRHFDAYAEVEGYRHATSHNVHDDELPDDQSVRRTLSGRSGDNLPLDVGSPIPAEPATDGAGASDTASGR